MEDLRLTDTAFEKYSRYGISLLTHMDIYFQMATLDVKRKMLGSIFPGKLVFQDGKYRTEGMNLALELILQKTSGLQNEKTGNTFISENVSGDVPSTGAFSNQFLEGMKQIYRLEPLLEVRLLRSGEFQVAVREEIAAMAV